MKNLREMKTSELSAYLKEELNKYDYFKETDSRHFLLETIADRIQEIRDEISLRLIP